MKYFTAGLASALSFLSTVAGYADPLTCSGTCNNAHDPSVIQNDSGTYYRFSTGGGISIHTASSIQGSWKYIGEVLPSGSSIDNAGSDDLWAPDVHKIGSTYYLYYAVSSFGTQNSAIGYATSTDLTSWTDHGELLKSSTGSAYNAIDPNLAVTGSTYYMNFGSFWNDIYQVAMSSPSKTSGSSYQIAYNSTGSHSEEGSFLFNYNSYWYLFFSSGQCCGLDSSRPAAGDEYHIMVCRGSSITGPFTDKNGKSCKSGGGTMVLPSHGNVYAPGGQGVYNDPSLGPVLYYHYVYIPNGYSDGAKLFGVNKIDFSSGWPVV